MPRSLDLLCKPESQVQKNIWWCRDGLSHWFSLFLLFSSFSCDLLPPSGFELHTSSVSSKQRAGLQNKSLILCCGLTTDWPSCLIQPPVLFPCTSVHSHLLYFRLQAFTACLWMSSKEIFCSCVATWPMFMPVPRFGLISTGTKLSLTVVKHVFFFFSLLLVPCCFLLPCCL